MSKQSSIQIFYIPGLGDGYDRYRMAAMRSWSLGKTKATVISMNWRDRDETYEQKLRRIQTAIRESSADRIVLVGESAGGAMVVNEGIRAGSRVDKIITICGKNIRADRLAPSLALRNPAFKDALIASDRAVAAMDEKKYGKKFTVFYSSFDPMIWLTDTKLPGATMIKLPTGGHFFSIIFALTVMKRKIIKEAFLDR
jgi:pimeloyl-ACP methyl ester carboxylesterase